MTARYLAINPTTTGFAYVVFETPERLVDWGLTATLPDEEAWTTRLEELVAAYPPEAIVTERPHPRCGNRTLRLLDTVEMVALLRGIWTISVARTSIRKLFPGASNKHDVAVALTERFPELRPRLPRKRKAWTSEDARMRIFDALAALLAAFPTDA
jgi:hypothetical protein